MTDSAWDEKIACRVLERRKRHNRMLVSGAACVSSALIVLVSVLFMNRQIDDPINQQISGLYELQYTNADYMTGEDTDSLLIETMAMR